MQPMAGPWLSPNVVTVKTLPMVLPDMLRLALSTPHAHAVVRPSAGKRRRRLAQSPTRRTGGSGTPAAPPFPCYLPRPQGGHQGADTDLLPAESPALNPGRNLRRRAQFAARAGTRAAATSSRLRRHR